MEPRDEASVLIPAIIDTSLAGTKLTVRHSTRHRPHRRSGCRGSYSAVAGGASVT